MSGDGGLTLLAVEDGQEAEHEGPAGRSEEASPIIPDGEVGRHDLDAEQDAWGVTLTLSRSPRRPRPATLSVP